ncbi:unnamed protein product [Xylocopa violacea]|uniref:Fatty acid desaturase domain-containing protein n=1 Tax=Xylocopa violacea TaxID=135666 RepID=A0ABP1MZG3_XYLVO
MHHKYTNTNADPHNPSRGFFFAHMGWLLVRKHPDMKKKCANLDLSDLMEDPFVVWQKKLYVVLMPLCAFLFSILVPWYFWNENLIVSYSVTLFRYTIVLHSTWLVNSIAHRWGMKPYDKHCGSTENKMVPLLIAGEGWHNYHHAFPWDYRSSELSRLFCLFRISVRSEDHFVRDD